MKLHRRVGVIAWVAATALLGSACQKVDGSTPLIPDGPARVAILVVDDFPDGEVPVDETVGERGGNEPHHTRCVVAGTPTPNEVGGHGGGEPLPPGRHGELVEGVAVEELTKLGAGAAVDVHRFNIPGFDLQAVIGRLGQKVDDLESTGFYRAVIVNMSFVVLPCDLSYWVHDRVASSQADSFKARLDLYLDILEGSDLARDLRDVIEGLETPDGAAGLTADSPLAVIILQALLADDLSGELQELLYPTPAAWGTFVDTHPGVVPVAAAGNWLSTDDKPTGAQPLPAPYAPAGWKGVVSVSASDDAGTIAAYSNGGEVMRPGVAQDGATQDDIRMVLGTSFAAPRVSAWLAVKLATAGRISADQCTWRPLDYASYQQGPGWNNISDLEGLAQGAFGPPSCPAILFPPSPATP